MIVYAVDLGTTNVKVALFDERLRRLALMQAPVTYDRKGARVEFDPQGLFDLVVELVQGCGNQYGDTARHDAVIAITGQAESLVLRNAAGDLVRPGISWLDARATAEAVELAEKFGSAQAFAITGEPEASATWPAAKLRWLARHDPDALDQARAVLMVKDDIIFRLTGVKAGEVTTRGFTYFYDVPRAALLARDARLLRRPGRGASRDRRRRARTWAPWSPRCLTGCRLPRATGSTRARSIISARWPAPAPTHTGW